MLSWATCYLVTLELSRLSKVDINSSKIKRHSGGVIDIRVVLKTVVRARAIYTQDLTVASQSIQAG